jgi:hypothetical protein
MVLRNPGHGGCRLLRQVLDADPTLSAKVAAVRRAAWNLITGSRAVAANSRNRPET